MKILITEEDDILFAKWQEQISLLYQGSILVERRKNIAQSSLLIAEEDVPLAIINFSAFGEGEAAEFNLRTFKRFLKKDSPNTQLLLISRSSQSLELEGVVARGRLNSETANNLNLQQLIGLAVKSAVADSVSAFQPQINYHSAVRKTDIRNINEELDKLQDCVFGGGGEKGLLVRIEVIENTQTYQQRLVERNKKELKEIEDLKDRIKFLYESLQWAKNNASAILIVGGLVVTVIGYLMK